MHKHCPLFINTNTLSKRKKIQSSHKHKHHSDELSIFVALRTSDLIDFLLVKNLFKWSVWFILYDCLILAPWSLCKIKNALVREGIFYLWIGNNCISCICIIHVYLSGIAFAHILYACWFKYQEFGMPFTSSRYHWALLLEEVWKHLYDDKFVRSKCLIRLLGMGDSMCRK